VLHSYNNSVYAQLNDIIEILSYNGEDHRDIGIKLSNMWMLVRWGPHMKRSQNIPIMMVQRGRDHGISRRMEGAEDVNDIARMVSKMMVKMDLMKASQRKGIIHVVQNIIDDEVESETTRQEPKEHVTMEEKMIREINIIRGKTKLDTLVYSGSLNLQGIDRQDRRNEKVV
jgi:hypothetical protein